MLPAIIAQLGLPAILDLIGRGLGKLESQTAKQAGSVVQEAAKTIAQGNIPPEQLEEANRHIETMAQLETAHDIEQIKQVNESLRAESASNDWYVRRMRPTFGYIMAATWGVQMLALAYTVVARPEQAATIMNSMEALGLIWSVGLSVLGIYVYKRSEEKKRG